MDKITKIKAEIERLKRANEVSEDKQYAQYELDAMGGYDSALDDVQAFIDSLPEEPASEDFEKSIYNELAKFVGGFSKRDFDIAKHFAQWQKQKTIDKAVAWLQDNIKWYSSNPIGVKALTDNLRLALEEE